jgi:hypothetical protein
MKPELNKASISFTQEGNCNGSAGDHESLTIDFESSLYLDTDVDGYFVLRTEGWSIDGVQDLEELFNRIRKILNTNEK